MNEYQWLIVAVALLIAFRGGYTISWFMGFLRFRKSAARTMDNLCFPCLGKWMAVAGGSGTVNHHLHVPAQTWAYDFCRVGHNDLLLEDSAKELSEYFSFGADIRAVAEGKVVVATNGLPDNPVGVMDPAMVYGNTIMIRHSENRISVYAHLKLDSLNVTTGDNVKKGDVIAKCGNSGNSTMPHLHFHIQTEEGFDKGLPVRPSFSEVNVQRVSGNFSGPNIVLKRDDIIISQA